MFLIKQIIAEKQELVKLNYLLYKHPNFESSDNVSKHFHI